MGITRDLETQAFDFKSFRDIGQLKPSLARSQVIGAAIGETDVLLAVDGSVRKATEKTTYGIIPALQERGHTPIRYFFRRGQVMVIAGARGIAALPAAVLETIAAGLGQILGQSGQNSEDIMFAPISGETEVVARVGNDGAWVNLTHQHGFTQAVFVRELGGFIGIRRNEAYLYFLSLANAEQGKWQTQNWQKSTEAMSSAVRAIPWRITARTLDAVPLALANLTTEYVDLTRMNSGTLHFLAPQQQPRKVSPGVSFIGEADETSIVAEVAGAGKNPQVVFIPQATFRTAAAEL